MTIQGSAGIETLNATLRPELPPLSVSSGSPWCSLAPSCSQHASFCLVSLFRSAPYYRALLPLYLSLTTRRCYSSGWPSTLGTLLCPGRPFIHVKRTSYPLQGISTKYNAQESRAVGPRSDILYRTKITFW